MVYCAPPQFTAHFRLCRGFAVALIRTIRMNWSCLRVLHLSGALLNRLPLIQLHLNSINRTRFSLADWRWQWFDAQEREEKGIWEPEIQNTGGRYLKDGGFWSTIFFPPYLMSNGVKTITACKHTQTHTKAEYLDSNSHDSRNYLLFLIALNAKLVGLEEEKLWSVIAVRIFLLYASVIFRVSWRLICRINEPTAI